MLHSQPVRLCLHKADTVAHTGLRSFPPVQSKIATLITHCFIRNGGIVVLPCLSCIGKPIPATPAYAAPVGFGTSCLQSYVAIIVFATCSSLSSQSRYCCSHRLTQFSACAIKDCYAHYALLHSQRRYRSVASSVCRLTAAKFGLNTGLRSSCGFRHFVPAILRRNYCVRNLFVFVFTKPILLLTPAYAVFTEFKISKTFSSVTL